MNRKEFEQGWRSGLPETACGRGSTIEATGRQRRFLRAWIAEYDVASIVDVGAGDLNWIRHMDWPHPVAYTALDLVPRHEDVKQFDIVREVPPNADMTLCLWVLNHLDEKDARSAVANLLRSSAILVYTWWPAMAGFLDLGYTDSVVIKPHKAAELRLLCV